MKANLEYIDRVLGYGGTCSSRRDARDRVERERERERERTAIPSSRKRECVRICIDLYERGDG